ncbi:unnamed protein product [Camellia sinensis]
MDNFCLVNFKMGSTNLEAIKIIKNPGGSLKDSFLDEGGSVFVEELPSRSSILSSFVPPSSLFVNTQGKKTIPEIGIGPKHIENAKILVANTAMDADKIEGELFADAGILAIEHADFDGIEHLALVTGGARTVNDSRVLLGGG